MIITMWEQQTKNKGGELVWEFNHISDGFDEAALKPVAKFPAQVGWVKSTWRKFKAELIDGKIVNKCDTMTHG